MNQKNNDPYVNLANWLDIQKSSKTNGAIITFPGCGLTFRLRKYLEKNKDVRFINREGADLAEFNIIALSFVGNSLVLKIVDDYLRMAGSNQKMVVVIDFPGILDTEEYKTSLVSSRIYEYYWHGAFDEKNSIKLIAEFGDATVNNIYKLTGGVSRLIKYICLKNDYSDIEKITADLVLQSICRPMLEVIKQTSMGYLETLNIVEKGKIKSEILRELMGGKNLLVNIKVDNSLFVVEDGVKGDKLARVEKDILMAMINNDGYLSREGVAGIKWGSENFADFSDQAINKTMRRLASKMKLYKIDTIWKTGFKLSKK